MSAFEIHPLDSSVEAAEVLMVLTALWGPSLCEQGWL